jgi:hypothetical protein
MSTSRRAGGAACAKRPLAVAVHVAVASVLKPMGLSSKVTGSSFTADMNTNATPPSAAGASSGAVIVTKT